MEGGWNGGGDEGRTQKKILPLVAMGLAQAAAAVGNPDGVGGSGGEGVHGGASRGDAGGADERGDDVQVAALPLMPTALQETMASPRREEWCVAANSAMAWGEIVGVSGRNS